MIRIRCCTVLLGLVMLAASPAEAHEDVKPKHGGIIQTASDLSFELVPRGDGAVIYVADHGKPMAVTGMSGKLTILKGSERTEANLVAAGDRLEAKGVKLDKGTKVVAAVTTPNRKVVTVRFAIK